MGDNSGGNNMPVKQQRAKPTPTQKKECAKCQILRPVTDFYKDATGDYPDGLYVICKKCINAEVDVDNIETVKHQLMKLDRPFLKHLWDKTYDQATSAGKSPFGIYIKNVQMSKLSHLRWKDGDDYKHPSLHSKEVKKEIENENNEQPIYIDQGTENISEDLIIKWGEGHSPVEYRSFERKYAMLKNHYVEKTAMHTEALITYIRYRVKEEIATAKGHAADAKNWGGLAKEAAQAAKINPAQLSQADLTDGLDSFGQLARQVEQAVDIIDILPEFIEQPKDKVDFTILCYINYERHLNGLPLVEYKDIYEFYEERKKDLENKQNDLMNNFDQDFENETNEETPKNENVHNETEETEEDEGDEQ